MRSATSCWIYRVPRSGLVQSGLSRERARKEIRPHCEEKAGTARIAYRSKAAFALTMYAISRPGIFRSSSRRFSLYSVTGKILYWPQSSAAE
jgi:hypothetical protein